MKSNKKIIPMLFTVIIGLTGCGENSSSTPIENISVDNGDLKFNENNEIIYENIELNMWSVTTGDDAQTQDEIIAQFNDMYDGMIKINTTHISRYDLESLLTTTMEFDKENAPDLFFSHGSRAAEYVSKGWLLPIESYVEKAGLFIDKEDFVESLLDSVTINNQIYGLPQDVHSAMVVYRKDILEKNNLKVPTNYHELVEVCETAIDLAAKGNLWIRGENSAGFASEEWRKATTTEPYYPFPIAFGDMWVHEFLGYTVAAQNGATFVSNDEMPAWNSNEAATGLQLLRDFTMPTSTSVNKKPLSKVYGSEYDVGNVPLKAGNAIFKLLGPWEYARDLNSYNQMLKNDGGNSNIDTMSLSNLFALDTTKEYASKIKGEGHAFMLMSTVKSRTKQCAAMVFADWMVNYSGLSWAKRGHLPSLKSVENSAEYRESEEYKQYISKWGSCDDYIVIPPSKYYSYIESYFKGAVQKTMASQFKDIAISSIIEEEYTDCVEYIELFA